MLWTLVREAVVLLEQLRSEDCLCRTLDRLLSLPPSLLQPLDWECSLQFQVGGQGGRELGREGGRVGGRGGRSEDCLCRTIRSAPLCLGFRV